MDSFNQGIGDTLRSARERRNLSIDDCADRTRIRSKYLQALEEEDFSILPEPAYARSFLRTYATSLGIEPTELTRIFDSLPESARGVPSPVELAAREAPGAIGRENRSRRRRGGRAALWALIGAIAVVGLAYVAARGYGAPLPIEATDYFSR